MYCFDTDVLSWTLRRDPSLDLIRRFAQVPPEDQFTTAITLGELLYGAIRRRSPSLVDRIRDFALRGMRVLPFDRRAAEHYGSLRADLESQGRRLAESDLRIASIALARDLTLVTGNVRHFSRISGLRIENWLAG